MLVFVSAGDILQNKNTKISAPENWKWVKRANLEGKIK